jgi:hypothetical protein
MPANAFCVGSFSTGCHAHFREYSKTVSIIARIKKHGLEDLTAGSLTLTANGQAFALFLGLLSPTPACRDAETVPIGHQKLRTGFVAESGNARVN